MKDLDALKDIRELVTQLIRLRRLWDRRSSLPGMSPKVRRLRADIDRSIAELQKLVNDL